MKSHLAALALASALACLPVRAQSDLSVLSAVSALPLASVVGAASVAVATPVILSAAGTVLVVRSVEAGARGTVYVLERASDGAQVSVEVVGSSAYGASVAAGTLVTVSVVGTGVILSAAGEAIAFLPNALGRALLHNERLTY
jgi:hypothetical protein